MIRALQLESFGKFTARRFEFSRLTLFSGPNEAGKSTVFDGLFDALCAPKANAGPGKRLQERYGPQRKVTLEWDGEPFQISETDFLDICSISALREPPRFSSAGSWIQTIKSSLFAGGINPGLVLERLEKRSSTKGSMKHMRELKELREHEQQLTNELQRLDEVRKESLNGLRSAQNAAERIQALEDQLQALQLQLEEKEELAAQYEYIRDRERLRNASASAVRAAELKERIDAARLPEEAEYSRILELEQQIAHHERDLHALQRLLQERDAERREQLEKLQRIQGEAVAAGSRAAEAERLLEQLHALRTPAEHPAKLKVWPLVAFGAAAVLSLIWAGSGWFTPLPWPITLSTGAALFTAASTALIFLLLRRRRAVKQQMQAERDFTAGLQEIVRTARHTLKIPAAAETPPQASGIQQLLEEVRMEPVQHRRRTELEQERLDTLEGHLNRDREQEKAIHDRLQQQRLELNGILRPFSAGNTEDLNRRKDEIQRSRDRLHEEQQRLAETMQQYGIQDIGILRDELGRRIDTLSEQIQVNTPSEEERRALSVQLEAIRSRKRELQEELSRCRIDHQRYRTAYDSRFGSLPDEYMQLENEIERVRSLQQNIEMERQAAEIAAGIVGELNSDTGEQLQQLGSQVADWFGDILNVPRTVRFYGFDDSLIQIEDAGGTARDINKLSSGTRDAFYLAARLALIAESNLNPGLVILDDPCITLDPERTGQAMQVLVRFLQSTGHQVVFLSKDPATAEYLRSALPDEIAERDFTEHVLERQPTLS